MPSFAARLRAALTGVPAEDITTALSRGAGAAPAAAAGGAARGRLVGPGGASAPPPDVVALLAGVAGAGVPATRDLAGVRAWVVEAEGAPPLALRDALATRAAEREVPWWPVVLDDALDDDALGDPPAPADELAATAIAADGRAWLADRWELLRADDDERDGDGPPSPAAVASVRAELVGAFAPQQGDDPVALLPATAAWQVPAVLGWAPGGADLAALDLAGALRHWEERWGAEVVGLLDEDLVLRVARPPADLALARELARELVAAAPLLATDDLPGPVAAAADLLAPALVGASWWRLYWS
ncbi:DUF4253 domain-containing protein [Streptomyces sp. NP160]|uniref:DUF4253 domain-containing protein n=1 Tax=Streptomyces sp. NP160 TaxID=2586637 RepID=UPI00111BAC37|nr:DUF4253 domain-containing protein [Streptomyces sp. NP160]TNM68526.1 DUF4253 domain-containing protein [Streptomyces sp. NP160]